MQIYILCVCVCVVQHRAVVHHQRRLVSGALCKWRERRQSRLVAARQTARALQHHTDKSTRRVWTAWMTVHTVHGVHLSLPLHVYTRVYILHIYSIWGKGRRVMKDVLGAYGAITQLCSIEPGVVGRYTISTPLPILNWLCVCVCVDLSLSSC